MADVDGNELREGDRIEIVQMDDPDYRFLVGVQGTVHQIPEQAADSQVIADLENDHVPGISTHQQWVRKIG